MEYTKVAVYDSEDGSLVELRKFDHPDDAEFFAMMTNDNTDGCFAVVCC